MMAFSLRAWPMVVILTGLAFAGTLALFSRIGVSFFPVAERDQFTIDIWTPEGASIANTDAKAKAVEKILMEDPAVVSVTTSVGVGLPRFWIERASQPSR